MFWSHLCGSEGFTPSYFNEDFFLFSRGESQIHRPVVEGEHFAPVLSCVSHSQTPISRQKIGKRVRTRIQR